MRARTPTAFSRLLVARGVWKPKHTLSRRIDRVTQAIKIKSPTLVRLQSGRSQSPRAHRRQSGTNEMRRRHRLPGRLFRCIGSQGVIGAAGNRWNWPLACRVERGPERSAAKIKLANKCPAQNRVARFSGALRRRRPRFFVGFSWPRLPMFMIGRDVAAWPERPRRATAIGRRASWTTAPVLRLECWRNVVGAQSQASGSLELLGPGLRLPPTTTIHHRAARSLARPGPGGSTMRPRELEPTPRGRMGARISG